MPLVPVLICTPQIEARAAPRSNLRITYSYDFRLSLLVTLLIHDLLSLDIVHAAAFSGHFSLTKDDN